MGEGATLGRSFIQGQGTWKMFLGKEIAKPKAGEGTDVSHTERSGEMGVISGSRKDREKGNPGELKAVHPGWRRRERTS